MAIVRIHEKPNAVPVNASVFILSTKVNGVWYDQKVTWEQLKGLIGALDNLENYYKKSETYTKREVNQLIAQIPSFTVEIVEELPTTDISTTTLYLVPKTTAGTLDYYDEFINLDGTTSGWEYVGKTEVDLSNYYTKAETETYVKGDGADYIVGTKTYSTLTTTAKTILAAINEAAGAASTAQADATQALADASAAQGTANSASSAASSAQGTADNALTAAGNAAGAASAAQGTANTAVTNAATAQTTADAALANEAAAFSDSAIYPVGAYVIYNKVLYKCTTSITTAGAWDATKWEAVTIGGELGTTAVMQTYGKTGTDESVYTYRQMPAAAAGASREALTKITGASVAWNQRVVLKSSSGYPINGITASQTDGVISLSGTATQTYSAIFQNVTPVANHIYAFLTKIVANPNNVSAQIKFLNAQITGGYTCNIGDSKLLKVSSVTSNNFGIASLALVDYTGFAFYANVIDLTVMLQDNIANYAYSLDLVTDGAGVAWLKTYGLLDDMYHTNGVRNIQSVNLSAFVTKNANDETLTEVTLDSTKTLRGILGLDANNNIVVTSGDEYTPGGIIRRFEERSYQSGDEALPNTITDGTTTVTPLATPITESAAPYNPLVDFTTNGTEQFIDAGVEAGTRDVSIPPMATEDFYTLTDNRVTTELPPMPPVDGNYQPKMTVTNGVPSITWERI